MATDNTRLRRYQNERQRRIDERVRRPDIARQSPQKPLARAVRSALALIARGL